MIKSSETLSEEKDEKEWGFLGRLKKNIEKNEDFEEETRRALRESRNAQEGLEREAEYNIAKGKLTKFMSAETPRTEHLEINDNLLEGYHFETVDRWINVKPKPVMVVEEIRTLNDDYQEIIDSYLKSNPAKIKELQILLNDWINYWRVVAYEKSPSGRRTVKPIDLEILRNILQWTGMELQDNWENTKRRYTIREDWMLGPQTFAVLCCFKKEYRKSITSHSNRRPIQR